MVAINRYSLILTGILGVLNFGAAYAQETARKPHVPLEKTIGQVSSEAPTPSLIVINSDGAKLDGDKLVLTGITKNVIVFADRPVRAAGHVPAEEVIKEWAEGSDSFKADPPNATISVLNGGTDVSDAVVTLKSAKLDGTTLTFEVAVLEGSLEGAKGPAALFIDYWRPVHPWGPRPWGAVHPWHGAAWYGMGLATGAAIGAAATAPYYAPYYAPRPVCPPGYWVGPYGHCRDTPYHGPLPGGWQ